MKSVLSYLSILLTAVSTSASHSLKTFSNVTIFDPPADYTIPRTLYARTLLLNQDQENRNVILATWENYLPNNDSFPYIPIYQSYDGGYTWSQRARVHDMVNNWGLRYQPFLYELPQSIGGYKRGDILMSCNSIPNNLTQTRIELYASRDKGYTWHFVSHIAHGGAAIPDNGVPAVWEPFLLIHAGKLTVFYSDQRDPAHGQKLVHQTSSDLLHWGPVVDDVAYSNPDFRPGMTTISHLPNGKYILTYEFFGAPEAAFAVYYRLADSPLAFNEAVGYPVRVADGTIPISSPYNVWTPFGNEANGTIALSCGTLTEIFVNSELGAPGSLWEKVTTPEGASYSRSLSVLPNDQFLMIAGGGPLGGASNSVTVSVFDLYDKQ